MEFNRFDRQEQPENTPDPRLDAAPESPLSGDAPVDQPQPAVPDAPLPPQSQPSPRFSQTGVPSQAPPPPYGAPGYSAVPGRDEYRWKFEDYDTPQPPHKKRRGTTGLVVFGTILGAVVVLALVICAAYGGYILLTDFTDEPVPAPSAPVTSDEPGVSGDAAAVPQINIVEHGARASDGELTSIDIAAMVKPSVVGVIIYDRLNTLTASSEGSGIIINEEGYIVTNAHVVDRAIGIQVTLDNGQSYPADLIGIDTKSDLAVIKISAPGLIPATFGNSAELRDGEDVLAIGNPGGSILAGSITKGIISSANRIFKASGDGYSATYIQTDAAINPGNSGGALVNAFGQVVGINSSKIVASGYEGIGFAIPINEAKPILDDLIRYGYVTGRVKLGVTGVEITDVLARLNNLPRGIYIESVSSDSDLAGKDIMRGDILTAIDGVTVESFDNVAAILAQKKLGDRVNLTFYRTSGQRAGSSFNLTIALVEDVEKNNTMQNFRKLPGT